MPQKLVQRVNTDISDFFTLILFCVDETRRNLVIQKFQKHLDEQNDALKGIFFVVVEKV